MIGALSLLLMLQTHGTTANNIMWPTNEEEKVTKWTMMEIPPMVRGHAEEIRIQEMNWQRIMAYVSLRKENGVDTLWINIK